jgi:hypothetical protein
MKCLGCGAPIIKSAISCEYCGKKVVPVSQLEPSKVADSGSADLQASCQTSTFTEVSSHQNVGTSPSKSSYMEGLSESYKEIFTNFDLASTGLKLKFGWAPFLFGPFWYFYKGLWGKGLLYLLIVIFTAGTFALLPWIYGSLFGVYDYYLLKKFDKQFW